MKLRELLSELELPSISQAVDNFKFFSKPQATTSGQAGNPAATAPTTPATPQAPAKAQTPPATTPAVKPAPVAVPAEPKEFNPATSKNTLVTLAKKMGITAVNDLSNFLGQCQVETASWTKAAENFNYTDPTRIYKVFTSKFPSPQHATPYVSNPVALANRALAGKNGNGDESTGDGWKYRGRGFIHLTGRELYAQAGAAVHPENPNIYIQTPTLLSSNPIESAKASIWYFLNKVGKGKTTRQVTRKVNSAGLKSKERTQAAYAAKQELAPQPVKNPRKLDK